MPHANKGLCLNVLKETVLRFCFLSLNKIMALGGGGNQFDPRVMIITNLFEVYQVMPHANRPCCWFWRRFLSCFIFTVATKTGLQHGIIFMNCFGCPKTKITILPSLVEFGLVVAFEKKSEVQYIIHITDTQRNTHTHKSIVICSCEGITISTKH